MILNSVSVDCVIFGFDKSGLKVLLVQTDKEILKQVLPEQASSDQIRQIYEKHPVFTSDVDWSLFGGHVPEQQDLDEFAKDLLFQATGLNDVFLQQINAFGSLERVPYIRVITIGYYALINPDYYDLKQSKLAKSLQWFNLNEIPTLCFDHDKIIQQALLKLRQQVMYHPIGFHLLPDKFTLTEIQSLYEVILNKKMDTRNFRKKLAKMELLIDSGQKQQNVAHRAAKLYQFDIQVYEKLKDEGLNFRIE
ncbi:MAG: NUDIX hydrolase [Bacteroidota bacterium]|nr:NUDIX hydrolase [Odoribacter sp.]MDP3641913.1 NUDIX hydrolase [Bacteroidota bacterium]